MEKISVIIPVYRVEKYLDKCVQSVVDQTYQDLEIILVDDGSPDACPQLCDVWAKKDNRITVIHKANGGLSDARNAGLDAAGGDYISFIDSDDFVSPDYIEKLYGALIENGADISAINYVKVDEQGATYPRVAGEILPHGVCTGRGIIEGSFQIGSPGTAFVVSWGKLYTRAVFSEFRFPKDRLNEDEAAFYPIYLNVNQVACVEDTGYYYLQRRDSIMGQAVSVKRLQDNYATWQERLALTCGDSALNMKTAIAFCSWMFLTAFPNLDRHTDLCAAFIKTYREYISKFIFHKDIPLPLTHKVVYFLALIDPPVFARITRTLTH